MPIPCPAPMDMTALLQDLKQEEADGSLAITNQTEADFTTDDFDEDRIINYHLIPPTAEWLKSRFFWSPSCQQMQNMYEQHCIDLLLTIDPNMLITLNRIIFLSCSDDIKPICDAMNVETFWFPDIIDFDDDSPLGCHWFIASSIIIDMDAIQRTVDELVKAAEQEGCYIDETTETDIAVYTTLTHEIRHLGLSNPFLCEDDYPSRLEAEDAVESWGREAYENWWYHEKKPNHER